MSPNCPPWVLPESDSAVPSVAAGLIDFQKFVYKNSQKHILNHGDLKTWHGKIFKGVVPIHYYAGNYRSEDAHQPCLQQDVNVAGRNGAPYAQVPLLMRNLSGEMHDRITATDTFIKRSPTPVERAKAALQVAALYAGTFLQIHPFLNGNGRTSRLITNYVLHRYGYPMPFYNPYPRPQPAGTPPVNLYERASAACMTGDFVPMYQYLLILLGTGESR